MAGIKVVRPIKGMKYATKKLLNTPPSTAILKTTPQKNYIQNPTVSAQDFKDALKSSQQKKPPVRNTYQKKKYRDIEDELEAVLNKALNISPKKHQKKILKKPDLPKKT
jgi:hypothetical protein